MYVVLSTERLLSNKLLPRTFAASLDGALGPMVSPSYVLLSAQFEVSVDEVVSSLGSLMLGLAWVM